ncbi:hypothetical protein AYO20_03669 [Fonsecaea nubica]|uniref:Uncharacterized protein n=1 Tax=Fonsecaea nubica TaxID=856822 RepID=A0A178D3X8_9EURO|nr:hypothetical protein AYO20_03669 [Fonsecaea nubica]OAL36900.1 hypothetical protein AYO20_03669 [Fonsecaea nubica]
MTGQWVMDEMLSFYYVEGSRSCSPQPHSFRGQPQLSSSSGWCLGDNGHHPVGGSSPVSSAHNPSELDAQQYPCHQLTDIDGFSDYHSLQYQGQQVLLGATTDFGWNGDYYASQPQEDGSSPNECDYSLQGSTAVCLSSLDSCVVSPPIDQTFTQPLSLWESSMGFNMRLPLSSLDRYLVALRQIIRRCAEATTLSGPLCRRLSAEGVLWVVRESWPTAEGFWNLTTCMQGFLYAELWRNFPCRDSYQSLPAAYRPTQMQLLVPHSPIIDWLPWPDLRDMIIMYQDQIDIDALCRHAILTMVAHRSKKTRRTTRECGVEGSSRTSAINSSIHMHHHLQDNTSHQENGETTTEEADGTTSFRVWDLTRLETLDDETTRLAADKLLFKVTPHHPRSASMKALQRAYNLVYDDFSTQKLEGRFFDRYPFLYCQRLISEFKIQDLTTVPFKDVGSPVDMTRDTVFRLKGSLEQAIGVTVDL